MAGGAVEPEIAEDYRGRRVIVTGGLGFIGSTLARELALAGADVTVVDSLVPEYGGNLANLAGVEELVRVNISDVRDPHSFATLIRDQDVLFNLAGQTSHLDSMTDPATDLEINCRAQLSILEACRLHNPEVKIVFASTRQIYGRPRYLPVDEEHPLHPVDVNGINKTAGEWYHLLYSEIHGISAVALRLTNTYGPRMRVRDSRQTFLGIWIRQLIEGDEILIYGDGSQRRDFNYVDDVVHGLLLAGAAPATDGRTYNLGSRRHVSLHELAELLVQANGGGRYAFAPFPAERQAIDIGDYYADFGRIEQALGWEPRVELEDGLERTLAYYRANADRYW